MDTLLQKLGPEGKGVGSRRGPVIEVSNILAPVDLSRASRLGLALAGDIARRFHSQLEILHVLQPPAVPTWDYDHPGSKETEQRRQAEEELSRSTSECGIDSHLVRSTNIRVGDTDFEICRAAVEQEADLIVIASRRRSLRRPFSATTCESVIRRAPCPVLTVREEALTTGEPPKIFFPLKRILVTTDFSAESKKALPYAAALAHKFDASLTLLHVVPTQLSAEASKASVLEEKRLLMEAREQLPGFREVELDPHVHVETLVVTGAPGHEICKTAEHQNADLIVMSTRGHSGLKRFAPGSVTMNVVRHAPYPVLVVPRAARAFLRS